jgi:hypothetical protein
MSSGPLGYEEWTWVTIIRVVRKTPQHRLGLSDLGDHLDDRERGRRADAF